MRLEHEINKMGEFWLSNDPESKTYGRVEVEKEGTPYLHLPTVAPQEGKNFSQGIPEGTYILGELEDGSSISIKPYSIPFWSFREPQVCQYIAIGIDHATWFNEVVFYIEGMEYWASSFLYKEDVSRYDIKEMETLVPDERVFNISKGLSLKVYCRFPFKYSAHDIGVLPECWFILSSEQKLQIEEYVTVIDDIIGFMRMMTLEGVSLSTGGMDNAVAGSKNDNVAVQYSLYYHRLLPTKAVPEIYHDKIPLKLFDAEVDWGHIFKEYLELAKHIGSSFGLISNSYYEKSFMEDTILNVARALEVYHRKNKDKYQPGMSDDDYNDMRYGFANRVKDMISPDFSQHILYTNEFHEEVRDIRNWFTHESGPYHAGVSDTFTLEGYIVFMRILFYANVLKHIGATGGMVLQYADKLSRLNYIHRRTP